MEHFYHLPQLADSALLIGCALQIERECVFRITHAVKLYRSYAELLDVVKPCRRIIAYIVIMSSRLGKTEEFSAVFNICA